MLQMDAVARQVCMAAGGDVIADAPCMTDAMDSVYPEVVRFSQFKRTDRTMNEYLALFDLLHRKAESKMEMGGPFPGTFVSVLHMQSSLLLPIENVAGVGQGAGELMNLRSRPTNEAPIWSLWPSCPTGCSGGGGCRCDFRHRRRFCSVGCVPEGRRRRCGGKKRAW